MPADTRDKFTVMDTIADAAMRAIDAYDANGDESRAVIYGGMACQLYAYPAFPLLLRPTHDIDIIVTPKLSADSFRNGIGRWLEYNLGEYGPATGVLRHVYEVKLSESNGSPLFIHSYKNTEKRLCREKKQHRKADF